MCMCLSICICDIYSELYPEKSTKLDVKKLKRCLAATGVEMVRESYIYTYQIISMCIYIFIYIYIYIYIYTYICIVSSIVPS